MSKYEQMQARQAACVGVNKGLNRKIERNRIFLVKIQMLAITQVNYPKGLYTLPCSHRTDAEILHERNILTLDT